MGAEHEEALVTCGTTKGDFTLHLHRDWSPNGYDRTIELFEAGFFDNSHFFRVVPKFLVQFGITYNADLKHLGNRQIQDDPKPDPPIPFEPGTLSFAGSGDNSRTSQLFISYGSAQSLGREKWETPVGKVVKGMANVEQFYSYGDMPPWGKGPVQGKIHSGEAYINDNFPLTDRFTTCRVERFGPNGEKSEEATADADAPAGGYNEVKRVLGDASFDSWVAPLAIVAFLAVLILVGFAILKNSQTKARKSN